jgi:hypothetical protein
VTKSGIFCVTEPLVTETVAEYEPARTLLAAVILSTLEPEPGAGRVAGVKLAETPLGSPVTENATIALKPPVTVTFSVTLLLEPAGTARELEEAAA